MYEYLILNSDEVYPRNEIYRFKNIINQTMVLKENTLVALQSIRYLNNFNISFLLISMDYYDEDSIDIYDSWSHTKKDALYNLSTTVMIDLRKFIKTVRTGAKDTKYVEQKTNNFISTIKKNLIEFKENKTKSTILLNYIILKFEYIYQLDMESIELKLLKKKLKFIQVEIEQMKRELLIQYCPILQEKVEIFLNNSDNTKEKCIIRIKGQLSSSKLLNFNQTNQEIQFNSLVIDLKIEKNCEEKYVSYNTESNIISFNFDSKVNLIKNLYIYTDITGCNKSNKIIPLKIIKSNTNNFDEYIELTYANPTFIPVIKSNINIIEISILDSNRKPIYFTTTGSVICELQIKSQ
jgi:hypothetical protein